MDPNATLEELSVAINEWRMEDAKQHARDLWEWLDSGGFPPTLDREQVAGLLVQFCDVVINYA